MSYYPNNFYQGYQPQFNPNMNNSIQGKSVESIDMVKVNEIPFGSYGVFPKTDLSEIYVKSWNNNGTTKIICYKPAEEPVEESLPESKEVLDRIAAIETKVNELNEKIQQTPKQTISSIDSKKKEALANGY